MRLYNIVIFNFSKRCVVNSQTEGKQISKAPNISNRARLVLGITWQVASLLGPDPAPKICYLIS